MKNTTQNIPYIISEGSLVLFFPGKAPKTVLSDHSNFNALVSALNEEVHDVEKLVEMSSLETAVHRYMGASNADSHIAVANGEVLYRGRAVHNVVVDKILAFMSKGHNYQPLVNFLERLLKNPSKSSVDQLYSFLEHGSMPLTPEGHFLGYKGVGSDYWSHRGNRNTVVLQGEVNSRGNIKNKLGATIEVERNSVCDDPEKGCADGVHVGSFDYAKNWAGSDGRLLLVKVDPAQVVSVPNDCSHQKLRCCFYEVVDEITETPEPIKEEVVTEYTKEDLEKATKAGIAKGILMTSLRNKANAQLRGSNGRFKAKAKKG